MAHRTELLGVLVVLERVSRDLERVASASLVPTGNVDTQVLLTVHAQPGITPGGLVAATGASGATVSRSLGHLEDMGLIFRVPAPFDGRSSNVRLTRKGRSRVARFEVEIARFFASEAQALDQVRRTLGGRDDDVANPASALEAMAALARMGAGFVAEVTEALRPFGIEGTAERHALSLLDSLEVIRPTHLGGELGLSTSGTSDLLDRLERVGIIVRQHDDPRDRRAVNVRLTPRGAKAARVKVEVYARYAEAQAIALGLALGSIVVDHTATA